VVNKVPTETVLRRSVRLLKPPNPHTATTSSTSTRKIEPYASDGGMVLRAGASERLGPLGGGGQEGSTTLESRSAAFG
jgi:hypothetical protein